MRLLFAFVLGVTLLAGAQEPWNAPVQVPAGVRYKKATPAVNKAAVEKIQAALGGAGKTALFSPVIVTIGPWLWREIGKMPPLQGGIPASFKVPDQGGELQAEGRGYPKEPARGAALQGILRKELQRDGGFQVRKLNPKELQLLWAIYPFDLEEPLFVAESAHHKILLLFMHGQVIQVDDFHGATLENFQR